MLWDRVIDGSRDRQSDSALNASQTPQGEHLLKNCSAVHPQIVPNIHLPSVCRLCWRKRLRLSGTRRARSTRHITDLPRQAARRNERATNPRNREDTALAARCQRRAHPASPLVLGQGLCLRVPACIISAISSSMTLCATSVLTRAHFRLVPTDTPPFYPPAVLQNGRGVPSRRCSAPDGNRRCLPIDLRAHRFGRAQKHPP